MQALDRAEKDSAKAVVIAGNQRVFSGGFDLAVFQSGDAKAALGMLAGGFELSKRCLTFPVPVIMAATGPAIAMGSFLLLVRRPPGGPAEVTVPGDRGGDRHDDSDLGDTKIMRARLTPAAFQRGTSMAATFVGDETIAGGWLDEIVEADRVLARAQEVAAEAASTLHAGAHLATKLKARESALNAIQAGIDGLATEFTLG